LAAIAVSGMIEASGVLSGLGVLALWDFLAALGCFLLSKDVLHYADMPALKV